MSALVAPYLAIATPEMNNSAEPKGNQNLKKTFVLRCYESGSCKKNMCRQRLICKGVSTYPPSAANLSTCPAIVASLSLSLSRSLSLSLSLSLWSNCRLPLRTGENKDLGDIVPHQTANFWHRPSPVLKLKLRAKRARGGRARRGKKALSFDGSVVLLTFPDSLVGSLAPAPPRLLFSTWFSLSRSGPLHLRSQLQ